MVALMSRRKVLPSVRMSDRAEVVSRPEPAVLRCGIYVRISNDRTGAGLGVQRQEEDCRALASRKGWEVVDVYCDNDVSASTGRRRPEWERLLTDATSGKVQAVVGWHVDRLTRRPMELEDIIDMADKLGLQLGTVTGDIDLGTPMGRLIARQLGGFARYEVEHKSERQVRANLQQALAGKLKGGGMRCFGYTREGEVVEAEAAVISEVANRVVQGDSLRSIVKDLRERGITTTAGKQFQPVTLRRLLQNPRLIGKRVHKGAVVADGDWEPILSPTIQRKVVAVLSDPSRHKTQPSRVRRYLLTGGLIRCGLCGHALVSQPSSSGKRGYVCRATAPSFGCGKIRIAAEPIEMDVAERVLGRLASPAIRNRLQAAVATGGDSGELLADQIGDAEQRLRELGEDYGDGKLSRTAFQSANKRIEENLRELRSAIARAAQLESLPLASTPEALADWWENQASLERRRDLVATLIDHVSVGPVTRKGFTGFDPDRVTYIWK